MEEVLQRAEAGDFDDPDVGIEAGEWRDANDTAMEHYAALLAGRTPPYNANDADKEVEEGELDESAEVYHGSDAPTTGNHTQLPPTTTTQNAPIGPQLPHAPNGSAAYVTAQAAATGVSSTPSQDQTLENLKMAYYWAGYYSGLYDGQQQAKSQPQPQP